MVKTSTNVKIFNILKCKNIIKFMLIFVCFERILETIGFPHSIIFLLDGLNILLLLNAIYLHKNSFLKSNMIKIHLLVFVVGLIVSFLYGVNILLIVWSMRNLLRFYIFFVSCTIFLKQQDVIWIYNLFDKLFYFNFVIIILQFALGYRQDELGGLFGTATGANAFSNIFILLVCTYNVTRWFEKREKTVKFCSIVVLCLLNAVLTETKVILFEIILIIGLAILMVGIAEKRYKIIFKGILIAVIAVVGIVIGAKYIAVLYDSRSNADFLSIEGLKYIVTRESGYTGYGDLNRLTAIKSINKLEFFNSDIFHRLFGMGMGATEYNGSISVLQSDFYLEYEFLHYFWFSHAWMYLEFGYIGLIGYMLGFYANIPCGIKMIRRRKKKGLDNSTIVTGVILSIMTTLLYIYNQSLRLESAYLIYFAFAAIFIGGKELHGK